MALSTYAELQTSIADFLNREDLTATIPVFIALCEADMNRRLRHWRMEVRATTPLDTQYSALPERWLEVIRLKIDTDALRLIDQATLLDYSQARDGTTGQPCYYAITNGTLEVFPIPDQAYTGEMVYYEKITALSDSNVSNWVLEHNPDAYLYGALVHSAPYLQDDARAAVWASMYQNAVDAANAQSAAAKMSGSGVRMRVGR
jgi:hypothetical protein